MKTCRDSECNNQFTPFLSTQKFCSSACTYKNRKESKPRQPIRNKSKKQASLDRAYTVLRKEFLNRTENKYCPVAYYFLKKDLSTEDYIKWRESIETTEVHHKAGRVGKLYLDVSKWLAVSRQGHRYIHDNPEEAYSKDWLIKSSTV